MSSQHEQDVLVLFSQGHGEHLTVAEDRQKGDFSALYQTLVDSGCTVKYTDENISFAQIENCHIVVIGAPETDMRKAEKEILSQFVKEGGGLLVVANTETITKSLPILKEMLAEVSGLTLHAFYNNLPTYLKRFHPHYITAGVNKVQIGDLAFLEMGESAIPLASTKATDKVVMACATIGKGRLVVTGDLAWLTDDLLTLFDNQRLARNVFQWLAGCNSVDIEHLEIPGSVKWGDTTTVTLKVRNNRPATRPQVEFILESDADALIDEPVRKRRSIPPDKTTRVLWKIQPQILGEQQLRLSILVEGEEPLHFDTLAPMFCLAPGFLTLEVKDVAEKQRTEFQTGDYFIAEGGFHWSMGEEQPYHLELKVDDGLLVRSHEKGYGIERWRLQAIAPGERRLTLELVETGQTLPAMVGVSQSIADRLTEIRAAYVLPLDAEIAERLKQVDVRLCSEAIRRQGFMIVPPEEFLQEAYAAKDAPWLQGVLAAVRREQYQNFDLLDLFLAHFAPTYLPHRGTFIPYEPALASKLAILHPTDRKSLEYNLLHLLDSECMTIKQNVAAYLLHEKYGHGFFFTQTRLGQQITLLLRHGFFRGVPVPDNDSYEGVAEDIRNSAIIVNEGFAAWLEVRFLDKLDSEVRQAAYPRYILLVQDATGMFARQGKSSYFQKFPSICDSPYREGFEYLDFIGRKLSLRCAVRAFLIATHIEFGIVENPHGHLDFQLEPAAIRELLFGSRSDGRSRDRLLSIAELIKDRTSEIQAHMKAQYCPADCTQSGCPLEIFIEKELGWRLL